MNTFAWHAWGVLGELATLKLVTRETALLVILAASLLIFRTLRERCLMVWIVGWIAYFASHHSLLSAGPYAIAISHSEFILALSLFVAGTLIYANARAWLTPLLGISLVLMAFAGARALLWPNSPTLRFALELSYHLIAAGGAASVLRFRRSRGEIGPWVLAAGLLLIHLDWPVGASRLSSEADLLFDVALGLGMLLVVLDESLLHTRRLMVLNALTTGIQRGGQNDPDSNALRGLVELMHADAAWFRTSDTHRLNLLEHAGLSGDFVRDRVGVVIDDVVEGIPAGSRPVSHPKADFGDSAGPIFQRERIQHVIATAIPGRKSSIGVLLLGAARPRSYAPDELEFVATCAHQLGMALENVHLVEEIFRSHRQWTNTFESIQDMVLLHDSEYRILKANPSLLARVGKSASDVVGQLCENVIPKDEMKWEHCPYCRGSEDGFYEGADPFGGFSVTSTSTYVDQGTKLKGTIHVVRDVTERRAAERKYRLLFERVQEGVFVTAPNGILLDCNDAFVRMLGHSSRDDLLGRNLDADFYASQEQRRTFRRQAEAHNFVRDFEVTLRRKDGSMLTAVESSFAIRDNLGNIERYQGFLLDVTEKKRAEEEIRRRNRELNALNAMAVIATQTFDLDEILNLTLRQVITLMGAEAGSLYLAEPDHHFRRRANWGQRISDRKRFAEVSFPEGFGDLVTRSRAEVLTAEYLPHLPTAVSGFIREADAGSSIWVLLWGKDNPIGMMGISRGTGGSYTSNDESLLVAISRQLSTTIEKVRLYEETCKAYEDLRRAQEQLLQSEKMSAIGQLIAGVAHELNNPLTAILGYAQLLESESLEAKAKEYVGKIFKQGQRTHRVVQNLLSFARQRKPERQQFDVVKVLEEALLLRDYDMKVGGVKLEREIAPGIPAVSGDAHQLEQVFLNIVNNAIDAMAEHHEANPNEQREKYLKIRVSPREDSVVIEFEDSGPGIKEPTRVFEPFYTTKSVGKGTGLGLSICYGIIKEHGGEISARNAEGGGAIIEVRLRPTTQPAAAPKEEPLAPAMREIGLSGRILLVEDEESVLEFERDVLSGAGAEVTAAATLEQMKSALASKPFDACILNGKMPGFGTVPEVHRWILENADNLSHHFLLTFANLTEHETRNFLETNHIPFLVKPFEIGDLIANARKLLVKIKGAKVGA